MARNKISLIKCYEILQIPQNSSIQDVKHAYRKRAFELHPDLNPNNPSSNAEFQNLNEAYVTIIDYLDMEEKKSRAKKVYFNSKANTRTTKKETVWEEELKDKEEKQARREQERKERQEREKQADERRRLKERAERENAERNRLREQIAKEDEKRRVAKEVAYKAHLIKQMEDEAIRNKKITEKNEQENNTRAYSSHGKPIFDQKKYHGNSGNGSYTTSNQQSEPSSHTNFAHDAKMREQILQELLEDNYARKVYEDIYNELHARKNEQKFSNEQNFSSEQKNSNEQKEFSEQQKNTTTKENSIHASQDDSVQTKDKNALLSQSIISKGLNGQIATDIKQGVSSWLKKQIDDELELFFPASKLVVGARMRLQIRSGWSGELQTIEVKLPSDFVPGKPFRLKGMGKRIGKWKGDLYLKLQIK